MLVASTLQLRFQLKRRVVRLEVMGNKNIRACLWHIITESDAWITVVEKNEGGLRILEGGRCYGCHNCILRIFEFKLGSRGEGRERKALAISLAQDTFLAGNQVVSVPLEGRYSHDSFHGKLTVGVFAKIDSDTDWLFLQLKLQHAVKVVYYNLSADHVVLAAMQVNLACGQSIRAGKAHIRWP